MSLVKRPIGFLGALVALILLSPVFLVAIVLYQPDERGMRNIDQSYIV